MQDQTTDLQESNFRLLSSMMFDVLAVGLLKGHVPRPMQEAFPRDNFEAFMRSVFDSSLFENHTL